MRHGAPRDLAICLDAPLWFPFLTMPWMVSHVLRTFADDRGRAAVGIQRLGDEHTLRDASADGSYASVMPRIPIHICQLNPLW